jgi:hypothetical protein
MSDTAPTTDQHQHSAIRDNHSHGTVGDFLKSVISEGSRVSIVSAYFTVYAYERLGEQLDTIEEMRFLFGEPTFINNVDVDSRARRSMVLEDESLSIPPEEQITQRSTAAECAKWLREKVKIRSMVRPRFLHGKLYHISQASGVEKAIAGSSNFTVNGLGLGGSSNLELNLVVDSDRDRDALRDWFDALWNDPVLVEDVKEEVLSYLEEAYRENSPEFVYFKTLYHLFESFLAENAADGLLDDRTGFLDSQVWNALYDFQRDGVRGAINKILTHNGCIIADSVGLGKTYEALAIIKYFELLNYRVLVIVPKKLSANWTVYQAAQSNRMNPFPDDRFGYSLVFHTDLGRASGTSSANAIDLANFNWGAYDLVVIDESHNFRGNPSEQEREDGSVRLNRVAWLMEKVIRAGVNTKLLLLSATPVNNTLRDLRNQIYLITKGDDQALAEKSGVQSIANTLQAAQTRFTQWADPERNPERVVSSLLESLDSAFFKLLDDLTIARSRGHIKRYYDLTKIGAFPRRAKPHSVYAPIDLEDRFPSYDALNRQIQDYALSLFNPTKYVLPEKREYYQQLAGNQVLAFTQERREHYLIGMMKVNFLKRLESSIHSFRVTLDRTIRKIDELLGLIHSYRESLPPAGADAPSFTMPDELQFGELDDEDSDSFTVGKKIEFQLRDLDLDGWERDLHQDRDALLGLFNSAEVITSDRDAKLAELKKLIKKKTEEPWNDGNKKVLLFTAFADTADYIYRAIEPWYRNEMGGQCALVAGTTTRTTYGKNQFDAILTNFSPRAKNRDMLNGDTPTEEIDLLIATDCISEGQNLQDCDYLINYDIHWNPVRIIQRFGRIDRIGSTNKTIHLSNFWPTPDLDTYINLKDRVEARMALVDVTATGEDNILDTEQIRDLISEDLNYRNRQLLRLRDEILDLEEMDQSISITDFTLDDFRMALLNHLDSASDALRTSIIESPLGVYAVVPVPDADSAASETERQIIKPGAIFCFRSRNPGDRDSEVNPMAPYFLVYVYDDGEVRYNFTHAKQILKVFSSLAVGVDRPYDALCDAFNEETNGGRVMDHYQSLVKTAIGAITQSFYKRGASRLTSGGRGAALSAGTSASSDAQFELITWLIVR